MQQRFSQKCPAIWAEHGLFLYVNTSNHIGVSVSRMRGGSVRISLFDCLEVRAGIEVAKAQLPDGRHGTLLQAVEQVDEIPVEVVIHLEGVRWLVQQHASGSAEHLYELAVFQGEQAVDNGENGRFIAHPGYRRFN